jgi:hypothetical protein
MLIWGRTNKDILVDSCGNDMIAKKTHYKVMGNFKFFFKILKNNYGTSCLCAICNEKPIAYSCLGHLIKTHGMFFCGQSHIVIKNYIFMYF